MSSPSTCKCHDRSYPTKRELEVIQLIASGRRTHEIASDLEISVKTAETHRANIMRKLRVHNAAELCSWFFQNGGSL